MYFLGRLKRKNRSPKSMLMGPTFLFYLLRGGERSDHFISGSGDLLDFAIGGYEQFKVFAF